MGGTGGGTAINGGDAPIRPVIGWHIGTIQRRVFDGRTKRGGQQCNFSIHYEVDDDEVPTVLELASYDGADEGSWVLLQQVSIS